MKNARLSQTKLFCSLIVTTVCHIISSFKTKPQLQNALVQPTAEVVLTVCRSDW